MMNDILDKKRDVMPELKDALKRAKQRASEARAAVGQQDKLEALTHELAWTFVSETEDDIERGTAMLDKERRKADKIEDEVNKHRDLVRDANDHVADLNEAAAGEIKTDELEAELEQTKEKMKEGKTRMHEQNNQVRVTNNTVIRMRTSIENYEREIDEARKKQERDVQAEQRPLQDRLAEIDQEAADASRELAKCRHSADDADDARRDKAEKLNQTKDLIKQLTEKEDDLRRKLRVLQNTRTNALLSFGEHGPNIQRAIAAESHWKSKPIGPLGLHVKLLPQHRMYADVLESFFSHTLNAYLVESEEDKRLLNQIFRNNLPRNAQPPIIKQASDATFDFSRGVPAEDVLTVHRALNFVGPDAALVECVLINASHIEKAALVAERPMGDVLMRTRPYNVESCFSANMFRIGGGDGGSSSQTMNPWRGQRRLNPDVTEQSK